MKILIRVFKSCLFLLFLNISCPLFCQAVKNLDGSNFYLFKIAKLKNINDVNGYCTRLLDRLEKEKGYNYQESLNKPIPLNWIENDIVSKYGQEIWIINPGEITKFIKANIKEFYLYDSYDGLVLLFRTDKDKFLEDDSVYLTFPKTETHNISSMSMEKLSAQNLEVAKKLNPTGIFLIDGAVYLILDDDNGYARQRKIIQLSNGKTKDICSYAISTD